MVGPEGKRVHLEAVKTPSGWVTTAAAVSRFYERFTPNHADDQAKNHLANRSTKKRQSASEKAAKQLNKVGI